MVENMKVFFTGDGKCPVCGKEIIGDKPKTHHVHDIEWIEKCEPCPIKDRCPCNFDYVRCNWKFTFKDVGIWLDACIESENQ